MFHVEHSRWQRSGGGRGLGRSRVGRSVARAAFTLVELLTVIAILVLLMSLLMPTLRKSKELARRTLCATHCRALQVVLTMYSVNHGGQIPLGYISNAEGRQMDYFVNWMSAHVSLPDMPYGCLENDKLLGDPRRYYCPSATHPFFQYDTDVNPWLHVSPVLQAADFRSSTRLGYASRPLAGWNPADYWVQFGWPQRTRKALPRTFQMDSGMAIVADIVTLPYYVDTHHGDGVNFTRLSGATQWFDRAGFNDTWQDLAGDGYAAGETAPGFYNELASPPQGVWFDMDRKGL